MVYVAARQLGCSPNTIKARIAKSVKLQELLEAESGTVIDTAELKLFTAIMEGDLGAIKYMLSTRGKNRGYVEKQQVEHSGPDGAMPGLNIYINGLPSASASGSGVSEPGE